MAPRRRPAGFRCYAPASTRAAVVMRDVAGTVRIGVCDDGFVKARKIGLNKQAIDFKEIC